MNIPFIGRISQNRMFNDSLVPQTLSEKVFEAQKLSQNTVSEGGWSCLRVSSIINYSWFIPSTLFVR